jgi:outer membrane receptor protein involved in Fe transport
MGHVGFSALRAEDADTGSRIENSPKYLGNLAVSVPLFARKFTASTELQAVGGRKTLSDSEVGPSFNTNLILRYKPFKWADATFGIYNLFDEDQRVPSALQHLNNGTEELPLRGRAFRGVIRGYY